MKRLLAVMVLVILAGCRPGGGGAATGAESSDAAVQQFVFAARGGDLQAMSAVWGDQTRLTRDLVSRQELERRLLIIACHMRHDESRIGAARPGESGRVLHTVEMTKGTLKASPLFTTVRNLKSGRWYVENIDLSVLQPFCAASVPSPQPTRPPSAASAIH